MSKISMSWYKQYCQLIQIVPCFGALHNSTTTINVWFDFYICTQKLLRCYYLMMALWLILQLIRIPLIILSASQIYQLSMTARRYVCFKGEMLISWNSACAFAKFTNISHELCLWTKLVVICCSVDWSVSWQFGTLVLGPLIIASDSPCYVTRERNSAHKSNPLHCHL